jgi:large-conductance mechanosensitive channel
MSEFVLQLRKFVVDNNIVGTSAGVCIALATKDGIQSLVQDLIIPGIVILLHSLHVDWLTKILPVHGKSQLNVLNFINQLVTWFLIIIISFVFVKFAFEYLLGITNNKEDKSKTDSNANTNKTDNNLMNNNPMNPNPMNPGKTDMSVEGFYYR